MVKQTEILSPDLCLICFGFGSEAMNTSGEAVRVLVIQVELNLGISLLALPLMNSLKEGLCHQKSLTHESCQLCRLQAFQKNGTLSPVESFDALFSNLTYLPCYSPQTQLSVISNVK